MLCTTEALPMSCSVPQLCLVSFCYCSFEDKILNLINSSNAGIDAGPSPRTCCDGFGYKNLYGAYHPPILTITDRFFFRSLHPGWLRHGIAEIIKMSVTKDFELFELLEKVTKSTFQRIKDQFLILQSFSTGWKETNYLKIWNFS